MYHNNTTTLNAEEEAQATESWRFTGFTQVENDVLRDAANLSPMARFTYTILRSYGWQDAVCWPGLARLSRDIGRSEKKVREYIRELEGAGLIGKKRRGQGNTNTYRFNKPLSSGLDRNPCTVLDRKGSIEEEDSEQEDSVDLSEGDAPAKESSTPTPKPTERLVKGLVSKLASDLGGHGVQLDSSQRGCYGRDLKDLVRQGATEERLSTAVERIVERRIEPDRKPFLLTPGQALSDVDDTSEQGSTISTKNTARGTTPEIALEAIRGHHKLSRYESVARIWDFTSEELPPDRITAKLGGTWDERNDNLRKMGVVARRAVHGEAS